MPTATTTTRSSLAIAPEDIQVGDFVGVLQASGQFPTWTWPCGLSGYAPEECVRLTYLPNDGGIPLKVKAVSLPFVLVKGPRRMAEVLDIRQCRLARLDPEYAQVAWNALKGRKKKKSK